MFAIVVAFVVGDYGARACSSEWRWCVCPTATYKTQHSYKLMMESDYRESDELLEFGLEIKFQAITHCESCHCAKQSGGDNSVIRSLKWVYSLWIHEINNYWVVHWVGHRQPIHNQIAALIIKRRVLKYRWQIIVDHEKGMIWKPTKCKYYNNNNHHLDDLDACRHRQRTVIGVSIRDAGEMLLSPSSSAAMARLFQLLCG